MPEFFGWSPTDWYEAMDGHRFSLALESEPEQATFERITALVLRSWAKGEANISGPFLWSGRVMTFRASGWGVTHLPRVRRWVMQVHAEIPVVDAVFHDIREGAGDPGEPAPSPPGDLTGRPVDDALPPLAPNPIFEAELLRLNQLRIAELDQARDKAEAAKLDKALAKQKEGAAVRFDRLDREVSSVSHDERLCGPFAIPEPPQVRPPNVLETSSYRVRAPGDHPIPHPRRAVARVIGGESPRLAYIDRDGGRHDLDLPTTAFVSLREDGARGVVAGSLAIIAIDFERHTTRWLPRPDPHLELRGVAYLADDGIAVLTRAGLYIIDPEDRIVAQKAVKKLGRLYPIAGGHGVCVVDDRVRLFATAGGKLQQIASLAADADTLVSRGDAVELTTRGGNLRVVGLETLRAPAKKRATRTVDVPAGRFEALDAVPTRPEPPPAGPAREHWTWQFTRADGVDVGQGFGQVMWQAPGGREGAWNGPRLSVGLQPFSRALYLHGPDLLLLFENDRKARVFTCTDQPPAGEVRELAPLARAADDFFDHDGAVVMTGPWGAVRIDGL